MKAYSPSVTKESDVPVTKPQSCVSVTPIPLFHTSPFCLGNHNFVFYVCELFIIFSTLLETLERQDGVSPLPQEKTEAMGTVCPEGSSKAVVGKLSSGSFPAMLHSNSFCWVLEQHQEAEKCGFHLGLPPKHSLSMGELWRLTPI